MKIALAQIDCTPGDITKNLDHIDFYITKAKSDGNDLIVFPEMSDLGYDMKLILKNAQDWDSGPSQKISDLAKSNDIAVVAGIAERDGDDVYNTLVIVDRTGKILGKYRKIHLITAKPICEHHHLKQGNALVLHTINGITCGFMTCYDIRFPEMARALTLSGAQMLITPSAFPLVRGEHWKTILTCRAIENQVYVAAPNRIGNDAGITFGGATRLIDPYGVTISSASEIDSTLITGNVDLNHLEQVRSKMKIQQDRQPKLYNTWPNTLIP